MESLLHHDVDTPQGIELGRFCTSMILASNHPSGWVPLCNEQPEQLYAIALSPSTLRITWFFQLKTAKCCITTKTFENGLPRDTFSQFSLNCTCRTSSWLFHSHNFLHSAARGDNGERRPHLSASAPLLSRLSNSWECNCNAWHHHWACPGQL